VTEVQIADYAYSKYCEHLKVDAVEEKDLPEYFVSAGSIKPIEHLEIQSILQKYVDSSISKTINIPADYPFEDFQDIYMQAYKKGLKGCTTFRPSDYITGVLVRDDDKKKDENKEAAKEEKQLSKEEKSLVKRPEVLEGTTYKIKTSLSPDAFYVTVNDLIEGDKRRPYELFINTKNLQHFSWIVAMTRLISAVFRHDPEPTFLVDELKSIYDPNGGYFRKGKYIPSLAAEIGHVIEQHLEKIGITGEGNKKKKKSQAVAVSVKESSSVDSNKMICPHCNERELINQENCLKCLACSYSKCS
jgi:ribonucleoside-diphosphate reductase alpha chain